jgi:3-hydroxyanthranilate 3,4-dioxygenase
MRRSKEFDILTAARECLGSYDEWPCLPAGIDPMPYLSRNRVPQPFYLASANDRMLVHLEGRGRVEFREANVHYFELACGDFIYLPARTPSRIVPETPCLQLIYRAEPWGQETALWYCSGCDTELHRIALDGTEGLLQRAYWAACQTFSADPAVRTCARCAAIHPPLDLTDIRWPEVAAALNDSSP